MWFELLHQHRVLTNRLEEGHQLLKVLCRVRYEARNAHDFEGCGVSEHGVTLVLGNRQQKDGGFFPDAFDDLLAINVIDVLQYGEPGFA